MRRILEWMFLAVLLGPLIPMVFFVLVPLTVMKAIGFVGIGVGLVALVRPMPQLWLGHRGVSVGVCYIGLMTIVMVGVQEDKLLEQQRLAQLRGSDPVAYLAELHKSDQNRWLAELKVLDPEAHKIHVKKVEAEKAKREAEKAKREKERAVARKPKYKTFKEKDFVWDKHTKPYKSTVVKGVNKLHRENSRCKDIDPGTVVRSTKRGTKKDPVFFVRCGKGYEGFNAYFSKSDVEKGRALLAARHIDRGRAVILCERYAKSRASHPSTVDFSRFLDLGVRELGNGNTQVVSKFTAKNSLNLEMKYDIACLLNAKGLIEGRISEAR